MYEGFGPRAYTVVCASLNYRSPPEPRSIWLKIVFVFFTMPTKTANFFTSLVGTLF